MMMLRQQLLETMRPLVRRSNNSLSSSPLLALIGLLAIVLISSSTRTQMFASAASSRHQAEQKLVKLKDYETVKYRQTFPKRLGEEAAVVEWGHSAIISALDAVVAKFGPQPSMGASFEVEAAPVLADPMDGYTGLEESEGSNKVLKNAEDIHGNVCVMTNSAGMSGVAMATIAKHSGAVALMVVNVLETDNPDFIYSLQCESDEECAWAEENIDIPVIMISLSSGNLLTTASSSSNKGASHAGAQQEQPQLSMPERVRLYAGGDRPFYEDVQNEQPAVYLIHNLLTEAECDALIRKATNLVEPLDDSKTNTLEGATSETAAAVGVQRAFLWTGMLKTHDEKTIDERIEQITGFPQGHLSDFQINKFSAGSYHRPHYDAHRPTNGSGGGLSQQIASIHIFLTDASSSDEGGSSNGGEFVFPLAAKPIKIIPKKGMAVVYHNTYEDGEVDYLSAHGDLLLKRGTKWTARKFVHQHPISKARRTVLPLIAYPFSGKAPNWVKESHNYLVEKFGPEIGSTYFDQMLVAIPALIFLCIATLLGKVISGGKATGDSKDAAASSSNAKAKKSSQSKKSKKD